MVPLISIFFREHKDRALMSLAAVLYHANHTYDSLVLLHTALDTCQEYSVYHFLLGNIYAVSTCTLLVIIIIIILYLYSAISIATQ